MAFILLREVIMPFQSKAQERFMYSQHPDIAKRWQKETKNQSKLPDKKKPKDKKRSK